MKNFRASVTVLGFFIIIILFLEIVFKMRLFSFRMTFESLLSIDFMRSMLFTLSYGLFVLLFLKLFKPTTVKFLVAVFGFFLVVLYFSQDIYYIIANNFYSLNLSSDFAKGLTFYYRIYQTFQWGHMIYFLPGILILVVFRVTKHKNSQLFNIRFSSSRELFTLSFFTLITFFAAILTIGTTKNEEDFYDFSEWDLYSHHTSSVRMIHSHGLLTYFRKDLQYTIFPKTSEEIDYEDYIEEFFSWRDGNDLNEMSGVFAGKNLIIIMAEALDTYAINPYLTPNLYQLVQKSWYFENFYAPHYLRNTADTEFMVQTGFYANPNKNLSMDSYQENYFPNTFPRLFREFDYHSAAFHNFSDYFYPREYFMPITLGYDEYYNDEHLDMSVPEERLVSGRHYWHSDLELFEKGLPNIIDRERFFAYFLTVTGHLPYDASRHDFINMYLPLIESIWEEQEWDAPIDESILHYHASQWEFDLAIGYLLETLEAEGVLDDTVIVIFGDHYAYGLEREHIWDYDTVKNPITDLNIHNVPFIIYATDIEPKTYSNFFSSVDVLPTLSNMFNLNLEYDRIIGQDAFNRDDNTIVFLNESFMTEHYFYHSQNREFSYLTDKYAFERFEPVEGKVMFTIRLNNYMLNVDYFRRYLEDDDDELYIDPDMDIERD